MGKNMGFFHLSLDGISVRMKDIALICCMIQLNVMQIAFQKQLKQGKSTYSVYSITITSNNCHLLPVLVSPKKTGRVSTLLFPLLFIKSSLCFVLFLSYTLLHGLKSFFALTGFTWNIIYKKLCLPPIESFTYQAGFHFSVKKTAVLCYVLSTAECLKQTTQEKGEEEQLSPATKANPTFITLKERKKQEKRRKKCDCTCLRNLSDAWLCLANTFGKAGFAYSN